jgi:hypothetical protein
MFLPTGPYHRLLEVMGTLLANDTAPTARFEDQDFDASTGPWSLVEAALLASNDAPRIKAAKVTKVLHRKRPMLVPIFDTRMAKFYGTHRGHPWKLWEPLRRDLLANHAWLTQLAGANRTPDGRPLTALRVLDIVIWEHGAQGCSEIAKGV